jgi:methylphosphotriester-DNA--protein-cysteine methyltransferase
MAIDIDKGFPKMPGRQRNHRSRRAQLEAVEIMKKCLLDGQPCKIAALEAGYGMETGFTKFKKETGMTMKQWQRENQGKPQAEPTKTPATH